MINDTSFSGWPAVLQSSRAGALRGAPTNDGYIGPHNGGLPQPGSTSATVPPQRGAILDKAKVIINGERQGQYGAPEDSFALIAQLWSAYLGIEVTPRQVAILMVLLKLAREQHQHKEDNFVDAAGYLGIAGDMK